MYKAPKSIQAPKPPKIDYWPEKTVFFNGGLNLVDPEWKVPNSQTPKTVNMWWYEGELSKRFGQEVINYIESNPAISMYKQAYEEKIILHIGDKLIAISKE